MNVAEAHEGYDCDGYTPRTGWAVMIQTHDGDAR